MITRIIDGDEHNWKEKPLQYHKHLDDKYVEELFLLKAHMPNNILQGLVIPPFYKECINS